MDKADFQREIDARYKERLEKFNIDLGKVLSSYCYDNAKTGEELLLNLSCMREALHTQSIFCGTNYLAETLKNAGILLDDKAIIALRNSLYDDTAFQRVAKMVHEKLSKLCKDEN